MSNSITIEFTERDDGSVIAEDPESGETADGSNRVLASVGLVSKLYGPDGVDEPSADGSLDPDSMRGFLAEETEKSAHELVTRARAEDETRMTELQNRER